MINRLNETIIVGRAPVDNESSSMTLFSGTVPAIQLEMPKVAKRFRAKLESSVKEFRSDVFSTDGSVLLYKVS